MTKGLRFGFYKTTKVLKGEKSLTLDLPEVDENELTGVKFDRFVNRSEDNLGDGSSGQRVYGVDSVGGAADEKTAKNGSVDVNG